MSRVLRLAVLAPAIALAAGLPFAADAQSASHASWRIVAVVRHCHVADSLLSVTATGPRDAWALGQPNGSGRGCDADLEHWNGTAWRRVAVPRGAFLGIFDLDLSFPLAATSASDAWIFPVRGGSFFGYSSALRWNGRSWRHSSFPAKLAVLSAVAFGPRDVWAFGFINNNGVVKGPAAARYNGHAWHMVRIPGAPDAVSAPSPDALWAVGPARRRIVAMHWSGRGWHVIAMPKIRVRQGQSYTSAYAAAAGPRQLWWSYQVSGRAGDVHIGLLRWDGTRWHHLRVPAAVTIAGAMTPDGHGGLWMLATDRVDFNDVQYWYHYSAGRWSRQLVPSPNGYSDLLTGLARVPGTTSAWAVGEADANTGNRSVGVIARYGHSAARSQPHLRITVYGRTTSPRLPRPGHG